MQTLKEIVYEKIVDAKSHDAYLINEEIWYVIPWNKDIWIHYTLKDNPTHMIILFYLTGTNKPHKWPVQTQFARFDLLT